MPSERNALAGAGISAADEVVLRALLGRGQANAVEVAAATGLSPQRVADALDQLRRQGLVARFAAEPERYAAADPRVALDALLHPAERSLRRARDAAAELAAIYETVRTGEAVTGPVEVVTGEEIGRTFLRLQQSAVREVRAFDRPPYVHAAGNPVEPAVLARGVRWRAIYHPDALEQPGALAEVRSLAALGEQARVSVDVPFKMHLVDERVALVPLEPSPNGTTRSMLVYASVLLDALTFVFDVSWDRAVPLEAGASADELSAEDRQLLALLAAGVKDETIGRQLGLSVRTMRRRVRRLLDLLGTQTRFQAGMEAIRRGWIPTDGAGGS
ncbi:helix-turn-helix domain-containing protein [Micromonospora sp. WMMD1082]|uniref:TrmB family transcriptional regulator n=1 Tax=Micromonospora sp. WMMD1082 TaxID=3016104 RepID=UPI0024173211|nr:helix-turn-helix domain-containing protein [Micromonospora sp. WMMD1082]MDG4798313.1 helix-turn-helix domain-containing protein [Micromonospora sp. WMMD1082]